MSNDRKEDLAYLQQIYKTAPPKKRQEIRQAAHLITNESRKVREMRQELIKNIREGKSENVRDIHEYVVTHKEYQSHDNA